MVYLITAMELEQPGDCCDGFDRYQKLRVELHDDGGGHYVVLKTERWAIDPDQMEAFAEKLLEMCSKADADYEIQQKEVK